MNSRDDRPTVLVVGGTGGLLGRALLPELLPHYRIRSLHRHERRAETTAGVEWVCANASTVADWHAVLDGVDAVVNVAWYRWGPPSRFEELYRGLERLLGSARETGVGRFVQVSVPPAPPSLESSLPYLVFKRRFDTALAESGLSYRTLRPTAMFGEGDVLLGVMMRSIHRYPFFPMFGDGNYHLSPIAAADVAHAIRVELSRSGQGTVDLGGPRRFRYRELTDLMFRLLHKRPRYWEWTPRGAARMARWLQRVGSTLLYAYEVEWLLADLLGLPPYADLDRPLTPVEPYLEGVARRWNPPLSAA
ncbi:MAG TPA: NAD(P)H-binding protein [Thermoplasmata archaeon]|nr:NAD(P)H-binding protein [Thermoplasmata archaeon]